VNLALTYIPKCTNTSLNRVTRATVCQSSGTLPSLRLLKHGLLELFTHNKYTKSAHTQLCLS